IEVHGDLIGSRSRYFQIIGGIKNQVALIVIAVIIVPSPVKGHLEIQSSFREAHDALINSTYLGSRNTQCSSRIPALVSSGQVNLALGNDSGERSHIKTYSFRSDTAVHDGQYPRHQCAFQFGFQT